MRALSADLALALSQVAHTVGDLWTLHARLSAALPGEAPGARQTPELATLAEEALAVGAELVPLRNLLRELAPRPLAPEGEDDPEPDLPLELLRAEVQCVLADHLEPALEALAGVTVEASAETARAALECVLADRLLRAIDGLSLALLVHEEGAAGLPFPR